MFSGDECLPVATLYLAGLLALPHHFHFGPPPSVSRGLLCTLNNEKQGGLVVEARDLE